MTCRQPAVLWVGRAEAALLPPVSLSQVFLGGSSPFCACVCRKEGLGICVCVHMCPCACEHKGQLHVQESLWGKHVPVFTYTHTSHVGVCRPNETVPVCAHMFSVCLCLCFISAYVPVPPCTHICVPVCPCVGRHGSVLYVSLCVHMCEPVSLHANMCLWNCGCSWGDTRAYWAMHMVLEALAGWVSDTVVTCPCASQVPSGCAGRAAAWSASSPPRPGRSTAATCRTAS